MIELFDDYEKIKELKEKYDTNQIAAMYNCNRHNVAIVLRFKCKKLYSDHLKKYNKESLVKKQYNFTKLSNVSKIMTYGHSKEDAREIYKRLVRLENFDGIKCLCHGDFKCYIHTMEKLRKENEYKLL